MPVGTDTYAYRRNLPHLLRGTAVYAVAFTTMHRRLLPPPARTLTLRSCIHDHDNRCWIDCVVVMPDHVDLIVIPHDHDITTILGRIKGASAYFVNRLLGRKGAVWGEESFDRIIRGDEKLYEKRAYLFDNPVRAGLATRWEEYPWIWFSR